MNNKSFGENSAIDKVVLHNKRMVDEMRSQLNIIEDLEKERKTLIQKLKRCHREAELCIERDILSTRRNASLVQKNRALQQKLDALSIEMKTMRLEFERNSAATKTSFDQHVENVVWNYMQQEECVAKKNAQLNLLQKQIQRLTSNSSFAQRFLADAIMQTLNEMNRIPMKGESSRNQVSF